MMVPISRFRAERSGIDLITHYARMRGRIQAHQFQRLRNADYTHENYREPLSLTEKILYGHMAMADGKTTLIYPDRYLPLHPLRVAMQDASAQMAMLQFMSTRLSQTRVPASIHCDHLIQAYLGASGGDLERAHEENAEIFDFLRSSALKYGIAFHPPGSGIIHQVVLENYAVPGALLIGTDSHTPNGGGLGMMAVGVGGVDAAEVMAGLPWELKAPRVVGVRLTGELQPWCTPKDVILELCGQMTVKGATGCVLEYFGLGTAALSATGMATICNMGAEMGATSSVFPYNDAMRRYLVATQRANIANVCTSNADLLCADPGADADTEGAYDRIIDVDLSSIRPSINGPFTPDRWHTVETIGEAAATNGWPTRISVGLIGSCTNSSYEDMSRASRIVQQALDRGVRFKSAVTVTPGSEQIRATMARDGMLGVFERAGATVLANACGPCIGQWRRRDDDDGVDDDNTILASFNRNFTSRNDGNPRTFNFLASPETVVAMSLAGDLRFNPTRDTLVDNTGAPFRLEFPSTVDLPPRGFAQGVDEFQNGPDVTTTTTTDPASVVVRVEPSSTRLQLLEPFAPRASTPRYDRVPILVKVAGKCTTDHISAAGVWLKYKGHLENISENTLIGAVNADTGEVNRTYSHITGTSDASIPDVAKQYKEHDTPWVLVVDHNYGEGSAREHAAMQPRFLGGLAVIARSFARIHETNLKKQGMLPLVFVNEADYDRIGGKDRVSLSVADLAPGKSVALEIHAYDNPGDVLTVFTSHSMTKQQIQWFQAGSALNAAAAAAATS